MGIDCQAKVIKNTPIVGRTPSICSTHQSPEIAHDTETLWTAYLWEKTSDHYFHFIRHLRIQPQDTSPQAKHTSALVLLLDLIVWKEVLRKFLIPFFCVTPLTSLDSNNCIYPSLFQAHFFTWCQLIMVRRVANQIRLISFHSVYCLMRGKADKKCTA